MKKLTILALLFINIGSVFSQNLTIDKLFVRRYGRITVDTGGFISTPLLKIKGISIDTNQIIHWNLAYSWGNHADAGYLTNFTEIDPIFNGSIAKYITAVDTAHWSGAYYWGNHATAGYQKALFPLSGLYFDGDSIKLGQNPITASTYISGNYDFNFNTLGGFFVNLQDGVKYNTINMYNPNDLSRIDFSVSDGNKISGIVLTPKGLKYNSFNTEDFGDSTLVNKRWVEDRISSTNYWIRQTLGKIYTSDSVGIKKANPMYDLDVDGNIGCLGLFSERINFSTNNVLIGDSTAVDWLNQGISGSVFIGFAAGKNANSYANGNIGIGFRAGQKLNGCFGNLLIGDYSGSNGDLTGNINTFIGSGSGGENTTGNENTVVGGGSFQQNTTGNNNVIVGAGAGQQITTGSNNIMIGYTVGSNEANTDSTVIIDGLTRAKEFAPFSSKMADDIRNQNSNIAGNLNVQGNLSEMGILIRDLITNQIAGALQDSILTHCFLHKESNYTPNLTQNVYTKLTPSFTVEDFHNIHVVGDSCQLQVSGDFASDLRANIKDGNGTNFRIQMRVNGAIKHSIDITTAGVNNNEILSFFWYAKNLSVNDWISFWITNTSGNQDPTFSNMTLFVEKKH